MKQNLASQDLSAISVPPRKRKAAGIGVFSSDTDYLLNRKLLMHAPNSVVITSNYSSCLHRKVIVGKYF